MDKKQLRRIFRRVWRRNKLIGGGARPGVSIERIVNFSAKRSRAKNLPYFDLWNELYDEYVSWILSLLTVQYAELKKRRLKSRPYQFHRATSVLLFRVFSDLVAIRILCRAGFDVAAKSLTRSTIEHIDALVLIIHSPSIAKEFNKSDSKERSNAFWHKHISRGKVRKLSLEIWKSRLGEEFDADAWDDWLYNFHGVLGMSIHPSFSGGIFSALSLGSMSEDKWIGFLGDRADIGRHILSLDHPYLENTNDVSGVSVSRQRAEAL